MPLSPGQIQVVDEQTAEYIAELFRAFSDPTRVRLISAMVSGEQSVGALAQAIQLSESAVSHQLRVLRQLRLVRARKAGRQVFYSLLDEHVRDLYLRGLEHVLDS